MLMHCGHALKDIVVAGSIRLIFLASMWKSAFRKRGTKPWDVYPKSDSVDLS